MKFVEFVKDRWFEIALHFFLFILIFLLCNVFKVPTQLLVAICFLFFVFGSFLLLFSFYRKRSFYQNFINLLESLDQKYLIGEMIKKPNFLEGKILYDAIYEIDKSMNEKLNSYKFHIDDFKEYVELWVHEIKVPISSCLLSIHNHASSSKRTIEEISRIEDYVEQILYYVRGEMLEKDYLIRECSLKQIVKSVVQKNKNRLLDKHISIEVDLDEKKVRTDSKWLLFILHQIINNSIQYVSNQNGKIRIFIRQKKDTIILCIWDNGIGINKSDLPRIFEKGFTGQNGRNYASSTGMGLYLCKQLIQKMGHSIEVESKQQEFTCVSILFHETDFYNILK